MIDYDPRSYTIFRLLTLSKARLVEILWGNVPDTPQLHAARRLSMSRNRARLIWTLHRNARYRKKILDKAKSMS